MINWPTELIQSKYSRWYEQIVIRAQSRILAKDVYVEKHHILPRSLGGDNSKTNLVILTAREHFICHWLLTKMFKSGTHRSKMFRALNFMRAKSTDQQRYSTAITSRVYEQIKPIISAQQRLLMTGRVPTEAHRKKMSASIKGRKQTEEHKKNSSLARKGKPGHKWTVEQKDKFYQRIEKHGGAMLGKNHTKEARQKMSIGQKLRITPEERLLRSARASGENNPNFGKKHSAETLAKIGAKSKGRVHSEETRAKMRASAANRPPPRPMSEETKRKISEARRSKRVNLLST